MTFHFYLKLDKKPDIDRLRNTFDRILSEHKGMDMKFYRNAWYVSSCKHDCPVIDIDGPDLNSYTPCRLDYKVSTIDLKVLHALTTDTWYLCFDFFHGAMDGRSGIQFVYDFFDVLNDRKPLDPEFGKKASKLINNKGEDEIEKTHDAFTVFPECEPCHWTIDKNGNNKTVVVSHDGKVGGISAHFASIIGVMFNQKSAKMIIPVDIRRHADEQNQDKAMYGNLFVPMFLEAARCSGWKDIHKEIWAFVKQKAHIKSLLKKLDIYSKIPKAIRQRVIKWAVPVVMSCKKFIYCALVSTLGTIDEQKLLCDDFKVDDYIVTIASFPFTAFTVISLQFAGHTNVSISWHSGRVPDKMVKNLVENINECIDAEHIKCA